MTAVLLSVSMAACLFAGMIDKGFVNRFGGNIKMYYLFNLAVSFVCALALFLMAGGFHASFFTLLAGLLFGLITTVQKISSMQAMNSGPYSYTAVITSLSTLIPTLSGKFIWNEEIHPIQYVGIILMMICFICSVDFKAKQKSASVKWLVFCALTFVSTGSIGVMQRWHQSTEYKDELNEFLIIAFAVSVFFSLIGMIFSSRRYKEYWNWGKLSKRTYTLLIAGMVIGGICVAANNKLNLYLSGIMDTAVFFPVVNGGGLILTSLAAFIVFKEKLSLQKWIGLIIGIIAVVLLCNPFG